MGFGTRLTWSTVEPGGLQYNSLRFITSQSFRNIYPLATVVLVLSMVRSASGVCNTPDCSPAEGWDNFANNLGSDLAPLLALFGEQVTTQFLSESLDWTDSLLVAIAPLGIITTMVAAIRISGSPLMRSLVGRAKETRGTVEADLMSSTSADVCELWSGESVVRVLGEPKLLHLVHVNDGTRGGKLSSFRDSITDDSYKRDSVHQPSLDTEGSREHPPNLLFNITFKPRPRQTRINLILFAFALQGGVLAFSAVTQYHLRLPKNDASIPGYAFPVFLVGTIGLSFGVFLCAQLIETSTTESKWKPADPEKPTRSIWLQQGGQTVGDQQFQAFSWSSADTILISHKRKEHKEIVRSMLLIFAIMFTLFGFITQFFGLRAAHSSVIVLQLAAILVMTAVRSWAHLKLVCKNDIHDPIAIEGCELDWLAKELTNCNSWEIEAGIWPRPANVLVQDNSAVVPQQSTWWQSHLALVMGKFKAWHQLQEKPHRSRAPFTMASTTATDVMMIRAELARLSKDWTMESRVVAGILANAIERSMNDICAKMTMNLDIKAAYGLYEPTAQDQNPGLRTSNEVQFLPWVIPVQASFLAPGHPTHEPSSSLTNITLNLERKWDESNGWGEWSISRGKIEAVLSLWVANLSEAERRRPDNGLETTRETEAGYRNERLVGPATAEMATNYRLWIYRGTPAFIKKQPVGNVKSTLPLGSPSSSRVLCMGTNTNIVMLYAQEIYTCFLKGLMANIEDVGGNTTARRSDIATSGATTLDSSSDEWTEFKLQNDNLESVASIFKDCELGTIEEAYLCIIIALSAGSKIPYAQQACKEARKAAMRFENQGSWEKSVEIDRWLHTNLGATNISTYDKNSIIAEIGVRLRILSHTMISQTPTPPNLRAMWDTVQLRYNLTGELLSENRALGLITLCMTFQSAMPVELNAPLASERKEMSLKLVSQMLKCLSKQPVSWRVVKNAQEAVQSGDPENITRFLCTKFVQASDRAVGQLFRRVLLDVRQRSGAFAPNSKFEVFLLDPASPIWATTGNRDPQTQRSSRDYTKIPADILLIRGFRTPLQMAAACGNERVVRRLLVAKAGINRLPARQSGRTALQAAAGAGHVEIVMLLVNMRAEVNARPARVNGRTILQAAAESENDDSSLTARLALSLAAKADVNADPSPISGRTALQAAAGCGNIKIVGRLLDLGAIVDAEPAKSFGRTALQAAAGSGHIEIVTRLLTEKADINADPAWTGGRTALQAAVEGCHLEVVRFLLSNDAAVNAPPAPISGRTALQAAAELGDLEIVQILLDAGANVNAEPSTISGRTALQAAAEENHEHVVAVLLKADANVDAMPAKQKGITVLQVAIEGAHAGLIKLILNSKFDLEAAFCTALASSNTKVVQWLTRNDAVDWNLRNPEDMLTAFERAVVRGHHAVVKELLSWDKIDPNLKGPNHTTPLHHAGSLKMVKLLITSPKVDKNAVDKFGNSSLHQAVTRGDSEVVERLLSAPGLNVDVLNNEKNSPLHIAVKKEFSNIIDLLLPRVTTSVSSKNHESDTPLLIAATLGDEAVVDKLLKRSSAMELINSVDSFGQTALKLAAERGYTGVVKKLLQLPNIDTTIQDDNQLTALHVAVSNGHGDVVALLLETDHASVMVDKLNFLRQIPLHLAAENGYSHIVQMLLDKDDSNLNTFDSKNQTPLHLAAKNRYSEIVQMLLDKDDSNLNTVNSWNETPLHLAAENGNLKTVEILLSRRVVDITIANKKGKTPRDLATKNGHHEISLILEFFNTLDINTSDSEQPPLHLAVFNSHEVAVKLFLTRDGIQINKANIWGQTPLHLATVKRNIEIVKMILGNDKLNVNTTNSDGQTALHLAIVKRHVEIVNMLLDNRMLDIDTVNPYNQRLLDRAVVDERNEIVKMLLDREGIDINAVDSNHQTPLHLAATNSESKSIKMLLDKEGIDINAVDSNHQTPLHLAATNSESKSIKMLLDKEGIDINAVDSNNQTALHLAMENGKYMAVTMFLDHKDNVRINAVNSNNQTVLHLAANRGHPGIVTKLLLRRDLIINFTDSNHQTALDLAATKGHRKVAEMLEERRKSEINIADSNKETPVQRNPENDADHVDINTGNSNELHLAAKNGHSNNVKILLDRDDVDINTVDSHNQTPLHMAAINGHYDVVILLLDRRDVKVSLQDNDQYTPYLCAIKQGYSTIANTLLRRIEKDVSDQRNRCRNQNPPRDILSDGQQPQPGTRRGLVD